MDCKKIKDMLMTDYFDGRLTEAEIKEINIHIKHCSSCTKSIEALSEVNKILKKPGQKMVPDYLFSKVLRRIDEGMENPTFIEVLLSRKVFAPALSFTVAVLLIFGTYFISFSNRFHPAANQNGIESITYISEPANSDNLSEQNPVNFGSAAEAFF